MESFNVYSSPREIYKEMLNDINKAKKYIFLETYIYNNDKIGRKFRDLLIKKAKQGLKIYLLLDAWGGTAKEPFFDELVKAGGEVRFFREIQYIVRFLSKNHERNHRKLLIIDNYITYIGSMNITADCLDWRELALRLKGEITCSFAKSFFQSWELYGELTKKRLNKIVHHEFEIIQDIPSILGRATENKFYELIKRAKKRVLIETPYFIPSAKLIDILGKSIKKGVKVILLIPYRSNVRIVDIARNRNLGKLYQEGVSIQYYEKKQMHSKLLIVDDSFFMMGSSNVDYRSFVYNFEINFVGKDKGIIKELNNFFNSGLEVSRPFDYKEWKSRSSFSKSMELILQMIKKYL